MNGDEPISQPILSQEGVEEGEWADRVEIPDLRIVYFGSDGA
jgi:hypothetical protein